MDFAIRACETHLTPSSSFIIIILEEQFSQ